MPDFYFYFLDKMHYGRIEKNNLQAQKVTL